MPDKTSSSDEDGLVDLPLTKLIAAFKAARHSAFTRYGGREIKEKIP